MRKKGIVAGAFALIAILLNIYIFNVVSVEWNPILVKILLCAAVDAVLLVCVLQMKPLFSLPRSILRDKGSCRNFANFPTQVGTCFASGFRSLKTVLCPHP